MTNSMIPYSFIPGTKAKAGEVNANFNALADAIETNKSSAATSIQTLETNVSNITETLATKADKTELVTEHTVTTASTNLNDYKTKGTYVFTAEYIPVNIPKMAAGILIVVGDPSSIIKQIWCATEENPEIFTRNCTGGTWSAWRSVSGIFANANPGYLRLPNGLLIQWGYYQPSQITYPIAYTSYACAVISKHGCTSNKGDTGYNYQNLTGLHVYSYGQFNSMNWVAVGI